MDGFEEKLENNPISINQQFVTYLKPILHFHTERMEDCHLKLDYCRGIYLKIC